MIICFVGPCCQETELRCITTTFFWYSAVPEKTRSMTPITWQAAVDDEEQRPLLQDILEAAVDDWRQAAVDVEEQWPHLQDIFEAAINGNHV